jgi:hypothetical protein
MDKGILTFVDAITNKTIPVPDELRNPARDTMDTYISTLPHYVSCATMMINGKIQYNYYCTNARVAYNRVIPYRNVTIPEVQLNAVWEDWSHNPQVFNTLVERGILKPNHVAWSALDLSNFLQSKDYSSVINLHNYVKNSKQEMATWDNTVEWVHARRMVRDWLPGMFSEDDDDDDLKKLDVPMQEPVTMLCPIARFRNLTLDDVKEYIFPTVDVQKDQYIKIFTGFKPDAVFTIPDLLDKIPSVTSKPLAVFGEYIYDLNTENRMHFTRIAELDSPDYAVTRIYDRIWLLRDYRGNYYEVKV